MNEDDFNNLQFYRAMLSKGRLCHSMSSVCLSVRPTVCDVQISWSHRLEYFENNFTVEQLKVPARIDPNMGDLVQREYPPPQKKIGWIKLYT